MNGNITYSTNIKELRQAGVIPYQGGAFYDYENFDFAEEFEEFYKFAQTFLERDHKEFNIKPARIFYSTDTRLNATATRSQGFYLIEIFKGTIFQLRSLYLSFAPSLKSRKLQRIREICARVGVEPDYLMFQFGSLYFFYHEVGHLLQRSLDDVDLVEFMVEECTGNKIDIQHVRELDADWFSSTWLPMHMLETYHQLSPKKDNPELLIEICSFMLASIFTYYLHQSKRIPTIYYNEKCHPHPLIRLSYMATFILDMLNENTPIKIDRVEILARCSEICSILMESSDGDSIMDKYGKESSDNIDRVEAYIQVILINKEKYPFLSEIVLRSNGV